MFRPLALTMCFALVGSLLASLVVIPALGALIVKRRSGEERPNLLLRSIQAAYRPVLELALRGRWVTVAIAGDLAPLWQPVGQRRRRDRRARAPAARTRDRAQAILRA